MNHDDICDCRCHEDENIVHCFPCCYSCKYCGQDIKWYSFEEHEKYCKERYEEIRRKTHEFVRSTRKSGSNR